MYFKVREINVAYHIYERLNLPTHIHTDRSTSRLSSVSVCVNINLFLNFSKWIQFRRAFPKQREAWSLTKQGFENLLRMDSCLFSCFVFFFFICFFALSSFCPFFLSGTSAQKQDEPASKWVSDYERGLVSERAGDKDMLFIKRSIFAGTETAARRA